MQLARLLFIAIFSMILVCLVFHRSLIYYFIQTYHTNMLSQYITHSEETDFFRANPHPLQSSLESVSHIANLLETWRVQLFENTFSQDIVSKDSALKNPVESDSSHTAELQNITTDSKQALQTITNSEDNQPKETHQTESQHEESHQSDMTIESDERSLRDSQDEWHTTPFIYYPSRDIALIKDKLFLHQDTEFLLIGDSLMQGIAITLVRGLRGKGLRAYNIAKQSTGLTYSSFFNWAKATKEAFANNAKLGVLVVCLGANDPWDITGAKFGSEKWNAMYAAKIEEILNIAREHSAIVVWFQMPSVKNANLNAKIAVLNTMYATSIESRGLFISTEAIMNEGQFSSYIKNNEGKNVLVRAQDGIHLSTQGSQIISDLLLERIVIKENAQESKRDNNKKDMDTINTQKPLTDKKVSDSPKHLDKNSGSNVGDFPNKHTESLEDSQSNNTKTKDFENKNRDSKLINQTFNTPLKTQENHESLKQVTPSVNNTPYKEKLKNLESPKSTPSPRQNDATPFQTHPFFHSQSKRSLFIGYLASQNILLPDLLLDST